MKTNSLSEPQKIHRSPTMLVVVSAVLIGILYYALFRDHPIYAHIPGFLEHRVALTQWMPAGYEILWLPSFVHTLATLLCVRALLAGNRTIHKALVGWSCFAA